MKSSMPKLLFKKRSLSYNFQFGEEILSLRSHRLHNISSFIFLGSERELSGPSEPNLIGVNAVDCSHFTSINQKEKITDGYSRPRVYR